MPDEHLAVCCIARTDADRGNPHALGNRGRNLRGNTFQHQCKGTCGLNGNRLVHQLQSGLGRSTLGAKATERGGALGSQTEVAHDRNASAGDCPDARQRWTSTFDLDGVCAGLFDEASGREDCISIRGLKTHKRKVSNDQWRAIGLAGTARRGGRQHDHLIDGNRHCGVVAEHCHRRAITDENHINAGLGCCLAAGCVVGGDHDDRNARLFLRDEIGQGNLAGCWCCGGGTPWAGAHAYSFVESWATACFGAVGSSTMLSIRRVVPTCPASSRTAGRSGS